MYKQTKNLAIIESPDACHLGVVNNVAPIYPHEMNSLSIGCQLPRSVATINQGSMTRCNDGTFRQLTTCW